MELNFLGLPKEEIENPAAPDVGATQWNPSASGFGSVSAHLTHFNVCPPRVLIRITLNNNSPLAQTTRTPLQPPQVVEYFHVVTARIFQRISENGAVLKAAFVVNGLGHRTDESAEARVRYYGKAPPATARGASVEPLLVRHENQTAFLASTMIRQRHRPEGIPDDIPEEVGLGGFVPCRVCK